MEQDLYPLKNGFCLEGQEMVSLFEKLISLTPHKNIRYRQTDIGMGNLFADCFRDTVRYCIDNQQWYVYDGTVWRLDKGDIDTQRKMQVLLELLHIYCGEIDDEPERMENYSKYIDKCSSDVIIRRCINISKNMLTIEITDFDNDPYLLNCANGVYDLRKGEITENSPELFLTKKTSTFPLPRKTINSPLKGQIKECKRWYKFIDEIMSHDAEKVAFLQRALGYSLLGVAKEECMFVAYGPLSRNGKGTLMYTISKALSSGYMGSVDTDLICTDKRGKVKDFNAPQPSLRKIVGTRIVTMSENDRNVMLASAAMKSITGRDELVTRGLHENPISFIPQFTIWLSTNYLPAINDDTVFKSNRIWVIEFNETFVSNRDNDLKEYFTSPENLPTVLKWLMDGCKDYLTNGLNPPECVVKATQAYREMYDKTGMFIRECCEIDPNKKILRSSLNTAYRNWCSKPDNRYKPLGSQNFYSEIGLRGFRIGKYAGEYYVYGIDLKETSDSGKIPLLI